MPVEVMSHDSNLIMWNCRGAARKLLYQHTSQYVMLNKPCMIVQMETRCETKRLVRTFQWLGYDGFEGTAVDGYARGIAVGWKKDNMCVHMDASHFQFMHLRVNYPNKPH